MTNAFDNIKLELKKDIALNFPNYASYANPLALWCDASNYGMGAKLTQKHQQDDKIIGFASTCFNKSQLNYSVIEKELSVIRRAVKSFKNFLFGVKFIIRCDHQPLQYLQRVKI